MLDDPHVRATFTGKGQPVHPTRHKHCVICVLPVVELEFKQLRQGDEPTIDLNVFCVHAVHSPPSGPVYPATHKQAVFETLPAADIELAGQIEHAADPVVYLNSPASHGAQGPPSGPEYPMSHGSCVCVSTLHTSRQYVASHTKRQGER